MKVSSFLELTFADDIHRTLFHPIQQAMSSSSTQRHTKISVIGARNMGMTIAQTIMMDKLVPVDAKPDKL